MGFTQVLIDVLWFLKIRLDSKGVPLMNSSLKLEPTSTQQKTYLVTGAAGFIGARFVESCHHRGIQLISVDEESLFLSRPEHRGLVFNPIIDRDRLIEWLRKDSSADRVTQVTPVIHAIIHLGAITDTRETRVDLLNQLNFGYSQSLWNYASERKIPFIYASSAATYGDGTLGFKDDESLTSKLRPLNLYGDSKLRFDLWALEQERNHNHPPHWAGFKFFNVYGYGELHKGFMASVVQHAFQEIKSTGKVTLFKSHKTGIADGFQKRDFIYVQDVIDVLHFALERPVPRGIYNLGTGQARTFIDLARAVFSALQVSEKFEFVDTPLNLREKYQYFTEAEMNRLRNEGYTQPFTTLEHGVNETIRLLKR